MYEHGWYQVAFQKDLNGDITPLRWGDLHLMAVQRGEGDVRVFNAICPHRGANLAFGGQLEGDAVRCPFHHYKIGLGGESEDGFRCREYTTLVVGGMVFIRLSDRGQPDLAGALRELEGTHTFVNGFEMSAKTSIELIIENGFDNAHFKAVHEILNRPDFAVSTGEWGELAATGIFQIPPWAPDRDPTPIQADYRGCAFSPGLFLAQLRGDPPFNYSILTSATPDPGGKSATIRLTLCIPKDPSGQGLNEHFIRGLLAASRQGLEADREIWDRLELDAPNRFTKLDEAVLGFQQFCATFREPDGRRASPGRAEVGAGDEGAQIT